MKIDYVVLIVCINPIAMCSGNSRCRVNSELDLFKLFKVTSPRDGQHITPHIQNFQLNQTYYVVKSRAKLSILKV